MHDLKFAIRAFTRTPATSGLIVVTLAVAIATAAIAASTIDMVWRFIPAVRTERLVFVASTDPRPEQSQSGMADGLARSGVSIPDLVDWSARTRSFEAFAAFTSQSAALTGLDVPLRITTVQATRNLLEVWGVTPVMGRTFAAGEDTPGRDAVIVVSHAFWRNQLSAAQDAVGKIVSIDGRPHTIVGVLPPDFGRGIFRTLDAVRPIVLDRERNRRDVREHLEHHPRVRGRGFARADLASAPAVALVSREAVRRYWPDENPIRSEIAQLDKTQPVFDIRSMRRVLVEDLGGTYLFTGMLGIFAIVGCCSRQPVCTDSCRIPSPSAHARSGFAWRLAPGQERFSGWSWRGEPCRWRSV